MDKFQFLANEEMHAKILLALAGLGVLFTLVGIGSIARALWKTKTLKSRFGINAVVLTLLGIGLAGFTLAQRSQVQQYLPAALQSDVENSTQLEQLKSAPLASAREPVPAGEWPQWRGPRRDGISNETGLRTDWKTIPPQTVWKRPLGGGYSSIAISGGRLYTMDKKGKEERVLCLDPATGNEIWVHQYPVNYAGMSYPTGPRATPTVSDGCVYTVGAAGTMLCLDARPSDGKARVLWQHDLISEFAAHLPSWGVACSPLIDGDLVCVQPGGEKGSIVAFDRRTGQVAWHALSEVSGYSSPVAATPVGVHQIICFTGVGVVGLRAADGNQLWYYPWSTANYGNIATPIVAVDYVFISSAYGTGCALLHVSRAKEGVEVDPVYVKRNKLMRNHHSTSVLHDDYLYGFDDGILKCVDLRRGEERWSGRGVGKGCVLYADGHLIVLSEDGTLSLVEATPAGFREKGKMQKILQGSDCWSLPALAGGRLYLRDHNQLICLDVRKQKGEKLSGLVPMMTASKR
jgi:outer membrane protein assembly factor BamB